MATDTWRIGAGEDIRNRTFEFACAVTELCRTMHAEGGFQRLFVFQLLNCSTSLAAMLEEARGAESRRDFISKVAVGLKEARESHVRLRICERSGVGAPARVRMLRAEADQLVAILVTIVKNAKGN